MAIHTFFVDTILVLYLTELFFLLFDELLLVFLLLEEIFVDDVDRVRCHLLLLFTASIWECIDYLLIAILVLASIIDFLVQVSDNFLLNIIGHN